MKKYLINGALALFAGAFVVGCAEKESDFVPLAEQKAKAFEEVFKEVYGEIDPYQRWGFTDHMVLANGDSVEATVIDEIPVKALTRGDQMPKAFSQKRMAATIFFPTPSSITASGLLKSFP